MCFVYIKNLSSGLNSRNITAFEGPLKLYDQVTHLYYRPHSYLSQGPCQAWYPQKVTMYNIKDQFTQTSRKNRGESL